MNIKVLKQAEKNFLSEYPGGFEDPKLAEVVKKHTKTKLGDYAKEHLAKKKFDKADEIIPHLIKIVTRSTLVSLFEKPKFRDTVNGFHKTEKMRLVESYYNILHGKEKAGFESLVEHLKEYKLAKWSLVSVVQSYYRPQKEVFVKPTTTKLIIEKLEIPLTYHPTPTWEFYKEYRKIINDLKNKTDKSLAPGNAAYCGFLMMSLDKI